MFVFDGLCSQFITRGGYKKKISYNNNFYVQKIFKFEFVRVNGWMGGSRNCFKELLMWQKIMPKLFLRMNCQNYISFSWLNFLKLV
jgi:hypothetical protein